MLVVLVKQEPEEPIIREKIESVSSPWNELKNNVRTSF